MMKLSATTLILLPLVAALTSPALGQTPAGAAGGPGPDTVRVAPPTGATETDRTSIVAALERARPGATVQFASGTYLVGELVRVETPRITLLGHPDGTVLRGCDPDEYEAVVWQFVREVETLGPAEGWRLLSRCGTFELTGGQVTVRALTFEYSRLGLVLGCCEGEDVLRSSAGGYRVEDNTFRDTGNSIRALLSSPERTVIRGNRFVNTFHAFSGAVSGVHVLDNDISVPEPGRVPGTGHPGFAIGITARAPEARDAIVAGAHVCEQNVIAGNRIDGHPDGILLSARQPGTSCRENVIRENTIQVRRVRFPVPWLYADLVPLPNPEDSTFVGVPLALSASAAPPEAAEEDSAPARVEDNRVEDNHIGGAEGLGIAISNASRNRVANNTITGVERREPFPGNTVGWFSLEWEAANGAGIWVSPGSDGNEIVGNSFEDIAAHAVFLEGDDNRVELRSAGDSVSDLGAGNRVTEPEPGAEAGADHHMHIQTAELTRIIDAGQRASGGTPKDAPPISAHTAADAVEALDAAGLQHGLALSGAYIWGSPLLHSPMGTAILDSLGVEVGDEHARVRAENEYLSEQVARYPERLVGACSVNPLADYALEEVELCEGDPHIRAFKIHLFAAGVDLTNTVHVARLRSFFQALDEADLSAVVHLRNRVEGYGAEDAGIFIREILAAAPDLPVQIAHMAGQGPYDAATDSAMQAFVDAFEDGTLDRDRLTFDVGPAIEDPHELEGDTARVRRATERNRRLATRMREVGIERVVIGTDWPAFPAEGDARTRVARAQALLRRVLPLEAEELDRFFANVGPVFRR